jgi:hypothetical protein
MRGRTATDLWREGAYEEKICLNTPLVGTDVEAAGELWVHDLHYVIKVSFYNEIFINVILESFSVRIIILALC